MAHKRKTILSFYCDDTSPYGSGRSRSRRSSTTAPSRRSPGSPAPSSAAADIP